MNVSNQEKQELAQTYRDKAWAHILLLDQKRGRKLNGNQIRCINIALGLDKK